MGIIKISVISVQNFSAFGRKQVNFSLNTPNSKLKSVQVIEIEANGNAPWEILRKYGGKYRFFEKIKMGGVGSPKIVYQSGLKEIDELKEDVGSDLCYINFEFLKKGLLGRINKGQKLIGVIMHFDEIENIYLSINPMDKSNEKATIGLLEIFSYSGEVLVCGVTAQGYGGIEKFFSKGFLKNKFRGSK